MTVSFQDSDLATPPKTLVVGSDTIGGIDYQRIKVVWGTTGTATELTTSAGLPVQITAQSSSLNVAATLSSGTQVIGSVLPSSQWTVTTTPSSVISVNQGTSPWVTQLTSGTLNLGSVAVTSGSVTLTSGTLFLGSVAVTSGSSVVTATLSSGTQVIGAVNQGTSPWVTQLTSGTLNLGSVAVTSGTVTLTSGALALGTVTLSSGTQVIGTVINSSGTQVIGSVLPSSTWSVNLTSGTQVIGAVNQGTSPWVTQLTSGTLNLGSVAVTSGTVTLTSGALAIGTVTLSSGTQVIGAVNQGTNPWTTVLTSGTLALGKVTAPIETSFTSSGTALTVQFANASSSSSQIALVGNTASLIRLVSAVVSTSSTALIQLRFTSSTTGNIYSGPITLQPNAAPLVMDYNLSGWLQTTGGLALGIATNAGVAAPGIGVTITYVTL